MARVSNRLTPGSGETGTTDPPSQPSEPLGSRAVAAGSDF